MSPSDADVRHELERLLASAVFANAGRMSRFLKFVVEQSLAGEGDRLKEYVIGMEVFDRDADYDPRVDSIVRVEAARLRAKLAEYYAGEGAGAAVVLGLPKGGYAPVVSLREASARPGAPSPAVGAEAPAPGARPPSGWTRGRIWAIGAAVAGLTTLAVVASGPWSGSPEPAPRIAVLPFVPDAHAASAEALALELTEGVTAELVRDGRFAMVASSAARATYVPGARPRDLAAALDADLLVEARVTQNGERVNVEARAASGPLEQKLWVASFAGTAAEHDALEREIAAAIGAAFRAYEMPD